MLFPSACSPLCFPCGDRVPGALGDVPSEDQPRPLTMRQLLAHPFFGPSDPDALRRDFDAHFSAHVDTLAV